MKHRILPIWNGYRRAVLHVDSPPNQVNDLKNAFYGGAVTIFSLITKISETLSENKAARALEEIHREFAQHADEAKKVAEKANATKKAAKKLKSITNRPEVAPVLVGTLMIDEWSLDQWHPTPDGSGPPEQLHLTLKLAGIDDMRLTLRFKSRQAWDDLTAIGDGHADEIWPDG